MAGINDNEDIIVGVDTHKDVHAGAGALRMLRLVGVGYRGGDGVRCDLPNVTSLPPLPNNAGVPWQFREARP